VPRDNVTQRGTTGEAHHRKPVKRTLTAWRVPCSALRMDRLPPSERLLLTGLICSVLVLSGGVVARLDAPHGIAIASGLLTLAALAGATGFAYAKSQRWSVGYLVLLTAAMPLFFGLYGVGQSILHSLGRPMAGSLLIAVAVVLAAATGVTCLQWRRHELRARPR
jgi:hypothetical protein